jgi:hypothetical protein
LLLLLLLLLLHKHLNFSSPPTMSKRSLPAAARPRLVANSFMALPILRNLVCAPHTEYTKFLYVKRQDQDESLFVLNLSVSDTPATLTKLFSSLFGPVSKVELGGPLHNPFAKISFVDKTTAKYAMTHTTLRDLGKDGVLHDGSASPSSCLERWQNERDELKRVPRNELGMLADRVVAQFDEKEQREKDEREKPQVDEDGFVKVVGKRAKRAIAGEASNNKKKKKGTQEMMPNFYKFEKLEARKQAVQSLKEKFAQTRDKLRKAKESRVFKPL